MYNKTPWIFLFLCLSIETKGETYCKFQDVQLLYPKSLFRFVSGHGCYSMIQANWLKAGKHFKPMLTHYNYTDGKTYGIPIVINGDGERILFDYRQANLTLVKDLYISEAFFENKWVLCAINADDCCTNELSEENSRPTPEYPCGAFWDGLSCFPKTKANAIATPPCPSYTSTSDILVCNLRSERECTAEGWAKSTNYLKCASAPIYRRRHSFHVVVLAVAVAWMVPPVVIFFSFAKLRKVKTLIFHRNLILAILLKNILVIVSKEVVILDAVRSNGNGVMQADGVGCKILAFIESASKNVIFTCMSIDAFYLHKIFVRPFSGETNMIMLYIIGTVAPLIPTTIWAILMGINDTGNCWMADSESGYQWISDGYKYIMLAINVLLLIDILRVLFLKLNKSDNNKQNSSALKATLVLLPLFGIPLLITGQRGIVDMSDCLAGDIYIYVTYTIEAFQGILLCVLFCYLNSDVRKELKRFYTKKKINLSQRFGWSQSPVTRRRTTATTVIDQKI